MFPLTKSWGNFKCFPIMAEVPDYRLEVNKLKVQNSVDIYIYIYIYIYKIFVVASKKEFFFSKR